MFWPIMICIGAALSVGTLNPIFVLTMILAYIVTRPIEQPWRAEVISAGKNPELPPAPTSATGCAGCALWFVVMGLALLLLVGVVGAVLEGKITP